MKTITLKVCGDVWCDPDGATRWLTDRKFVPYVDDFKDITDLDLSDSENIIPFLKILCDQSTGYYQKKFLDLQEKILYNKNHFQLYVENQYQIIKQGIVCQI